MINRIKSATIVFIKIALVWLIALFFIRIFEVMLNGFTHEFPKGLIGFMLWSWLADSMFWLKWLIFEYVVFVPLFLAYPKLAKTLFEIFIVSLILIQLSLIQYFSTSLVPLGADFYSYSLADIKQTVGASGGISFKLIISFVVAVVLIVWALRWLPKKIGAPLWLALLLPLLSLTSSSIQPFNKNYENEFANNLMLNKADYFFNSSLVHFFPGDDDVDIYADAYIGDYGDATGNAPAAFSYLGGPVYPFYRKATDPDVLTPFFNKSAQQPNIVMLLVEGLGRAFTNEGAYLGNFTPFIDSLANKSLYWKNFLSEGGRTFAVLPSIMGSLPFGKNGFLELGQRMPAHLSLYSLLKFNGYKTSFYYGGDAAFDHMEMFLKRNQLDEINDLKTFPSGYTKLPAVNGFSWGYNDKELFRYYLTSRPQSEVKSPELNVILTVSTHNPFLLTEQAKYIGKFEQRMTQLGFEAPKKDTYRNYKLQYSTILYADDALRTFFNNYKKRKDFANTIFIITGDHRMPEIPMSNKIDRYHVPLIIYSPLLKRTAQFESISTHFDITPSLLAFLQSNYKINIPANASWMGQGLDTARSFRNIHSYPLIQTKTDMVDFIMSTYHLNGTSLYKMNGAMQEEPITDKNIYDRLKNAFDNFKRKNTDLGNGTKILPDSVIQKYSPKR